MRLRLRKMVDKIPLRFAVHFNTPRTMVIRMKFFIDSKGISALIYHPRTSTGSWNLPSYETFSLVYINNNLHLSRNATHCRHLQFAKVAQGQMYARRNVFHPADGKLCITTRSNCFWLFSIFFIVFVGNSGVKYISFGRNVSFNWLLENAIVRSGKDFDRTCRIGSFRKIRLSIKIMENVTADTS